MTPPVAALLLLASVPTLDHAVATVQTGCVVAAPHEGFDSHTAPIARAIAARLGWGCVVAEGFRKSSERRWLDVNRPTERSWEDGGFGDERETEAGRAAYAAYQERLDQAAGRAPLDLLVEVHGHARTVSIGGRTVKVQAIELATRGFAREALEALRARYRELAAALPEDDRVPLAVEQLDPEYDYAGARIPFYFGASGAKQDGSLAPERTRRALHFELPPQVRFDPARRATYAELLARLVGPLAGER
jgi:hypothetical protein